jgi:hypothetical protein
MKTKTISDYPLLMGELIRPRPMAQDPSPTLREGLGSFAVLKSQIFFIV